MSLDQIFPPIKDKNGQSVVCQCGCRRVARHIHHIIPRCKGGTDHPNNLLFVCQKCHVRIHSQQGDFSHWGKMGGEITARKGVSIPNLKQFQGEAGRARWERYCERRALVQMGVA